MTKMVVSGQKIISFSAIIFFKKSGFSSLSKNSKNVDLHCAHIFNSRVQDLSIVP